MTAIVVFPDPETPMTTRMTGFAMALAAADKRA
jgi:hypothetical protein